MATLEKDQKETTRVYICRRHRIDIEKAYFRNRTEKPCPRCGREMELREGQLEIETPEKLSARKKRALQRKLDRAGGEETKKVYEYLVNRADGGRLMTKQRLIAHRTDLSLHAVKYSIKQLRDVNLIRASRRGPKGTEIELVI